MKILHIVPGTNDVANGMVVVAKLLAKEQGDAEVVDLKSGLHGNIVSDMTGRSGVSPLQGKGVFDFFKKRRDAPRIEPPSALASLGGYAFPSQCDAPVEGKCEDVEEVWVHGMWLPKEWLACWRALRAGKRLVRMTHGSLSPLYLKCQSPFKKWLVGPIERWCLRRCSKIVATCAAEKGWIEKYLGKRCPAVEVTDVKRFFKLTDCKIDRLTDCEVDGFIDYRIDRSGDYGADDFKQSVNPTIRQSVNSSLHLLYLGRRHPLKGLEYLEAAVRQIKESSAHSASLRLCVKIISSAFGEELEKVWQWCDVLVLPTLSDNFGLVIAEALERGKRVITTDGAPAWGDGNTYGGRLVYLNGYRDGSTDERIALLKKAIETVCE